MVHSCSTGFEDIYAVYIYIIVKNEQDMSSLRRTKKKNQGKTSEKKFLSGWNPKTKRYRRQFSIEGEF